ncbi:MAG TPA: hypothetical protein VGA95_13175 [Thermodesulfobacteriota bacterium]
MRLLWDKTSRKDRMGANLDSHLRNVGMTLCEIASICLSNFAMTENRRVVGHSSNSVMPIASYREFAG